MIVKFEALGIDWEADVDYCPPGPPAGITDESPPDAEECEIVALWNDHTKNAVWLLDSTVVDDIYQSATEAAREAHRQRRNRGMFDEP